jgi:hypothetical protein
MKTPMQKHIEWLKDKYRMLVEYEGVSEALIIRSDCIKHAESMLDYEREYIKHRIKKDKEGPFGETDIW